MIMYRLLSPFGQLNTLVPVHQLVPMSEIQSSTLEEISFENTESISFEQALELFARDNSTAKCDCKTKCRTKHCSCRRAGVGCSTKCHVKLGQYANRQ